MSAGVDVRLRVVMAQPDPRHPGGITGVVRSWHEAGLAEQVDVVDLPTSAMGSPLPVKLAQATRALARLLPQLVGRRRADVVHLHASTGSSLYRKLVLALACRLAAVPYVAHEHSGELREWIGPSMIRRAAARSLYKNAATVVILARRWHPLMQSLGATRIEVVPNGLAASERGRLADARQRRASQVDTSEQLTVLLFYARWVSKKGPDRLAAALRALPRANYEVRLYGSGDRDAIAATFADLHGKVSIGGWLEGDRKIAELAEASALIAPSRGEGLPVALIEARAAGTPVIATDVGGVGEALSDYSRGVLVDSGDHRGLVAAIRRLLDDEWPPPDDGADLPPALRAEVSVERLVRIWTEASQAR